MMNVDLPFRGYGPPSPVSHPHARSQWPVRPVRPVRANVFRHCQIWISNPFDETRRLAPMIHYCICARYTD